jgi:protein SCO1
MGLMLAILMPAAGYLLVKYYSEAAVHMPCHAFLPDTVIVKNDNGKISNDTIWHTVKNVSFINQFGDTVSMDKLKGKIVVMNTIFTRCGGICPKTTQVMRMLQESFKKSDTLIQFVSITVDPLYDSAQHLRKFANRFGAVYDNWWFVTGDKNQLYDFMLNELKANVADTAITPDFVHTDLFFLLDKKLSVRGFYHSLDEKNEVNKEAMGRLAADIPMLMLEKQRKRTFGEFLKELFGGS